IVGAAWGIVTVQRVARGDPPFLINPIFCLLFGNVMYLLGPIVEMYANWLADAGEDRFLASFVIRLIRGYWITAIFFVSGTLLSLLPPIAEILLADFPTPN
ncbi:MAG: hypothetical protein N2C14_15385, partial [Planctomycetales bacterium]